jgi:hypothetical protein
VQDNPKRTAFDHLEDLGKRSPGYRLFGSMKYPLAYQSFTIKHPVVGSAILSVIVCVGMYFLTIAATQGRGAIVLAVVWTVGALIVFVANWIGAKRIRAARLRVDSKLPKS